MRPSLLLLSLLSLSVYGQKLPQVNFNHFYLVIDSSDLSALQNSGFIKNEFAATITKTTKAGNGETWTGTYMQGLDNYFEIFDSSGGGAPLGYVGVGLSVDGIGELKMLNSELAKKFQTETHLREKEYPDKKIPWFTSLGIKDSVFDSISHIEFWIMEYKKEYFDYNHLKDDNKKLTRINYLRPYEKERKGKILKRFTGITFKATDEEQEVFSNLLLSCGFRKIDDNSLVSPENFKIDFIRRKTNDRYALAFIEFESSFLRTDTVKITDNIQVQFKNHTGKLIFR
ncbi:MAG TPA: DUF5829 family protein [Puia sp.]|nr:DUF5829 family protein [Puia sp.]